MEKTNWIGKSGLVDLFASVEKKKKIEKLEDAKVEEEETISDIIKRMEVTNEQYYIESKLFYADVDEKIKEIQKTLNVVVDEQEIQRISSMNITELLQEMNKNINYMKEKIDKIK